MNDLKTIIITIVGAIFTLLAPIQNFMYAMMLLFGVNFIFGVVAAVVRKEGWSTKKALCFIWYCATFFVTACATFIIGHLLNEQAQATAVVKILCYVAIYVFGTNIFRNWLQILNPGTAWYKFVDLIYYVLSVKFIERFSIVKEWQEQSEDEQQTHHKYDTPHNSNTPPETH